MRAIICDRCGKTQKNAMYGTNAEINRVAFGSPREAQLCSECTEDLIWWIREGKKRDSNPE